VCRRLCGASVLERKVRNFYSLYILPKRDAILTAISSKSYRHLSRSLATPDGDDE
jgi:hypothetical protein